MSISPAFLYESVLSSFSLLFYIHFYQFTFYRSIFFVSWLKTRYACWNNSLFLHPSIYLQFMFVYFWRKKIVAKAARKMLVKLTLVHNQQESKKSIFHFLTLIVYHIYGNSMFLSGLGMAVLIPVGALGYKWIWGPYMFQNFEALEKMVFMLSKMF